jgi:trans-2,3-dihydro-3-hydroxyanthranilate isomerase
MRKPCYVVDSFTGKPFAGNPAGVVLDGADLTSEQMRQIARELRHSETAFPLPARDPTAQLHLRWFSPTVEVAFCGHATLAALHVLIEAQRLRAYEGKTTHLAFTCKAGKLRAELTLVDGAPRILIETPRCAFEPQPVEAGLLSALGLVPEVLDPTLAPRRSQSAESNLWIAVRDREALARIRPDEAGLIEAGRALKVFGFCVFVASPAPGIDAAVRCFFPAQGILEDPVTGMAAGQLGLLLQDLLPEELPRRLVFTQGDEVARPGRVEVELRPEATPGDVRAWIGGRATTVLRGELDLR